MSSKSAMDKKALVGFRYKNFLKRHLKIHFLVWLVLSCLGGVIMIASAFIEYGVGGFFLLPQIISMIVFGSVFLSLCTCFVWWLFSRKDTMFHRKWENGGKEPFFRHLPVKEGEELEEIDE